MLRRRSAAAYRATSPPSTGSATPSTNDAASEHSQTTVDLDGSLYQPLGIGGQRHVRGDETGVAASGLDETNGLLTPVHRDITDNDVGAFPRERQRARPPDARASARDQRDSTLELSRHSLAPLPTYSLRTLRPSGAAHTNRSCLDHRRRGRREQRCGRALYPRRRGHNSDSAAVLPTLAAAYSPGGWAAGADSGARRAGERPSTAGARQGRRGCRRSGSRRSRR
jgi:hypothetical protein